MPEIPEGYGVIAGRSRANAQAALDAAEQAGVDSSEVVAVAEGYLVPDAVLEAFHGQSTGVSDETQPIPTTPTSDWKKSDIESWAQTNDIDLGEARTKADMLAAIDAAGNKEE